MPVNHHLSKYVHTDLLSTYLDTVIVYWDGSISPCCYVSTHLFDLRVRVLGGVSALVIHRYTPVLPVAIPGGFHSKPYNLTHRGSSAKSNLPPQFYAISNATKFSVMVSSPMLVLKLGNLYCAGYRSLGCMLAGRYDEFMHNPSTGLSCKLFFLHSQPKPPMVPN